ncbi:MAG: LacI family DNA-binding transcriptional regulator [Pseudomonadota bacterium]
MTARVTSQDVARRAGVSQSAVSRVFTAGRSASAATAEKVRQAAAELGYRPNVLGRSLITGQSRVIGLVVAYLDNYFYPEVVEKLSNALQARGYHVMMFMAQQTAGNIDDVLDEILDYQVDGIVTASVALSSDLAARCQAAGVPVVLFNRKQDDPRLSAVSSDNFAGGLRLAEFLVAGGHQRLAYIAGWEGAATQRDREAGFLQGLRQAGLTLHARASGDFKYDTAAQGARDLMHSARPPDAIFVANDHMAIAVMDVLRSELGLEVPGDVSVVGFDDVTPAGWPAYALTTVRQDGDAMVAQTVDLLLGQIEQADHTPRRVVLDAPLIVRRSARIPEGWA